MKIGFVPKETKGILFVLISHPQKRRGGFLPPNCSPKIHCFPAKFGIFWSFFGPKLILFVLAALQYPIGCSNTIPNMFQRVRHPQNRVWGPTTHNPGQKNTTFGKI